MPDLISIRHQVPLSDSFFVFSTLKHFLPLYENNKHTFASKLCMNDDSGKMKIYSVYLVDSKTNKKSLIGKF